MSLLPAVEVGGVAAVLDVVFVHPVTAVLLLAAVLWENGRITCWNVGLVVSASSMVLELEMASSPQENINTVFTSMLTKFFPKELYKAFHYIPAVLKVQSARIFQIGNIPSSVLSTDYSEYTPPSQDSETLLCRLEQYSADIHHFGPVLPCNTCNTGFR